jgi:hypothetical protein
MNPSFLRWFYHKAALHSWYLCLKVLVTFSIITVFGSQKGVKNVKQGFAPGHKNVHLIWEEYEQYHQPDCPNDIKALPDPQSTTEEQVGLLAFLDKNSNVFAWSTSDLIGVSRVIIEVRLQVNANVKPRKQKFYKMSEERVKAAWAEI